MRVLMKHSRLFLNLVAMLSILALFGPRLLSVAWSSVGLAMLSQALIDGPDALVLQTVIRAETLLRQSTTYASENRYAWRGLGFALAAQGREDEAITAWQAAGEMAKEFIELGTRARKAKRYQEALDWYEKAALVEPELRAPWYHIGLTYEQMDEWEEAAEAYREGLQRPEMSGIQPSDIYFRLGWILERKLPGQDAQMVLALYDQALKLDTFSSVWMQVQTHYARGEVLQKLGRKREAMKEYGWVIARRPSDYWAHVHLGSLTWELDHDADGAETLFVRAIDIDNRNKWAYRGLGLVYQETGRRNEALEVYRQVLVLDPTDVVANEQLTKITGGHE